MKRCAALLLVLFFVASSAFGQTGDSLVRSWWTPGIITSLPVLDSLTLSHTHRSVDFDFDHTSSLYNWGGGTQLFLPASGASLTDPSVVFTTAARSELRQDTRTRTNEGTGLLQASFPVTAPTLAVIATLFGDTYSLNQPQNALGNIFSSLQRLSDGYGLAGLRYEPTSDLELTASAGASYKSFLYGRSSGTIIQAKAETPELNIGEGSLLDLNAHLDERRFPSLGEAGRNDGGRIHYVAALGDGGLEEASVLFTLKRQDFYFAVDTLAPYARQERSEMSFDIRNTLRYPISPNRIDLFVDADVIPRTVNRSTKGLDFSTTSTGFLTSSTFLLPSSTSAFDLDLSSRLQWKLTSGRSDTSRVPVVGAGLRYSENSQTNDVTSGELSFATTDLLKRLSSIFQATSFDGRQSILGVDGSFPVAAHDVLQANLSSRLFRYDTPSEDNHDDRDELYLNGLLGYTHVFTPELSTYVQIRLAKSHLVYLKSDRSAQNYVGKTVSLVLGTNFSGRRLANSISAEVFSNYSVYDFSLPSVDPTVGRDYLIRGVNGGDSLRLLLGAVAPFARASAAISMLANVRLYERGSYNVSAFSERPLLRTTEVSGDLTFDLNDESTPSPTLVRLGARLFYQLRSAPASALASSLSLQERISRFGPLAIVVLDQTAAEGFRLYGSLWYSILAHDQYDLKTSSSSVLVEGRLAVRWTF